MAFPASVDSLPRPAFSSPLSNPSHTSVHAGLATAIEVLEAKVGADDSRDSESHDFKIRALEGCLEDIQAELDGFDADVSIADVDGLQAALDGKSSLGHMHAIADVTNLQSSLNAKSNAGHS